MRGETAELADSVVPHGYPQPMITLADATTIAEGSFRLTTSEVTISAALLAALVSIANIFVTHFTIRSRDRRSVRMDMWNRRLNELYAPIVLLLDQDAMLHGRLREGKSGDWHILDHVKEVLADKLDRHLALSITDINRRIVALLESKAGLVGGPAPNSFAMFLAHQKMLDDALHGREYSREPASVQRFPKQFETDIRDGHKRVSDAIRKELGDR
jgi:hypothetical protein